MLGQDRSVWLQVANGVKSLAENGRGVWAEPAAVRKVLGELLGVFPVTHVQIDIAAVLRSGDTDSDWASLLSRSGHWGVLLPELALAVTDAVRPPMVWGLGLPGPQEVAVSLGDESERSVLKAGLQLAAFLQVFRASRLGFVTVDLRNTGVSGMERAITPIFRNSEMYGWLGAICVRDLAARRGSLAGAKVTLVHDGKFAELLPLWERGEVVGGGLSGELWNGGGLGGDPPQKCLLYGEVPERASAKTIVETGRILRSWLAK
jgi:hypothetical protein